MKRILTTILVLAIALVGMAQTTCLNQSVIFAKGSATVAESQMARIEVMAEYIMKHPKETVIIGGFTSKETPKDQVQGICDRRAQAVKKVLTEKFKIPATRVMAIGAGVCTKYDETSMNELVEFFLDK